MATYFFSINTPHVARVALTVTPAGLACQGQVTVGTAVGTVVPFTSTGLVQNVDLPITVNAIPGSFHAGIAISAGGGVIASATNAADTIVVFNALVGNIIWS